MIINVCDVLPKDTFGLKNKVSLAINLFNLK